MVKLNLKVISRAFLMTGMALSVSVGTLIFNPAIVEEPEPPAPLTKQELLDTSTPPDRLAPDIPEGVPEYTLSDFNYLSTEEGRPQWKVHAIEAQVYQRNLVHAQTVKAELYGEDGRITFVTAREAKYRMDKKDLELFGNVHTIFPDGFVVDSQYLLYKPDTRWISIPRRFSVAGNEPRDRDQWIAFESHGIEFDLGKSLLELPAHARVSFFQKKTDGLYETRITSDRAQIERNQQMARFSMYAKRPLEKRFVHVQQPRMAARSRKAELRYGKETEALEYMILYEDVLTREIQADESIRYATSGKAAFHSKQNIIVLSEFPQVYQENDTLTGEVITLHRDTDIVEVSHSNAFSSGSKPKGDKR